jgi:DNA-binding CsgD family transcriptional regulator
MRAMKALSPRELEVVAAWWHQGSVKEAAALLGIHEQTAKNQLFTARMRAGATTTLALARLYSKDLPTVATLRRRVRERARKAS